MGLWAPPCSFQLKLIYDLEKFTITSHPLWALSALVFLGKAHTECWEEPEKSLMTHVTQERHVPPRAQLSTVPETVGLACTQWGWRL